MIPITQLTGRLGNLMFDFAFITAYARDHGVNDGYFPQDIKWFESHKEEIIRMYRQGMNSEPRPEVAIHVRRGDYLDQPKPQYPLPVDYYERAMAMFPGELFLFFSDDPQWCCETFSHRMDCLFRARHDEIEDLNEMARCKHTIIANSTFSWWAAYINPFGGRVIMPKQWEHGKWGNRVMTAPARWERI